MSWLYHLHMALLVSGIAPWWPRGSWRKALAMKRGASPIRRLRDIQKLLGLWSVLLLSMLVATGVLLALPVVLHALLAPTTVPSRRSNDGVGRRITLVQAFGVASRALPEGRIVFIDVPSASDGAMRIRMQIPGDPHRRFPGSYVFIDQVSGRVVAVHDVRHVGIGNALAKWIRPLHDGTIGGTATRVLAALLGLAPALLLATDVLHWRRRRGAVHTSLEELPALQRFRSLRGGMIRLLARSRRR